MNYGSCVTASIASEIWTLCNQGKLCKALDWLDSCTYPVALDAFLIFLKECSKIHSLKHARQAYEILSRRNVRPVGLLGCQLVSTLAKCGGLDDAYQVLISMPYRSVYSWSAIILGYTSSGQGQKALEMYNFMLEDGVEPDTHTFTSLFKACSLTGNLAEAERLHAEAQKKGIAFDYFIGSTLVSMYSKCGTIIQAETVFGGLGNRNIVCWNAMLSAYVEHGEGWKALCLYRQMHEEGLCLDQQTFMFTFQACSVFMDSTRNIHSRGHINQLILDIGRSLHADAQRKGFATDNFVGSTLITMYGKCGNVAEAEKVIDGLPKRDIAAWNGLLTAYLEQGHGEKALQLYRQILQEGITPGKATFIIWFRASVMSEVNMAVSSIEEGIETMAIEVGKALHVDAEKKGFTRDDCVGSALVNMYSKLWRLPDAERVFEGLHEHNDVSCNIMTSAYVDHCHEERALLLFRQMQEEHLAISKQTFLISLQACSMMMSNEETKYVNNESPQMKWFEIGLAVYAGACKKGLRLDVALTSAVINIYGKCGSLAGVESSFDELVDSNVAAWNAIFLAYVQQNDGGKALQLYEQMHVEGVEPNAQTYVVAFQASTTLAEVDQEVALKIGQALHDDAWRKGFHSDIFIASSVMALYGKCGVAVKAESVFAEMLERDTLSWNALLSAYVEQGEGVMALLLLRQMREEGVSFNSKTLMGALQACNMLIDKVPACSMEQRLLLDIGQALHAVVLRNGFLSDICVSSALLKMYGHLYLRAEAESLFVGLSSCDLILWSTMLSVYVHLGKEELALQIYEHMQLVEGVIPDTHAFVIALQACGNLLAKGTISTLEEQPTRVLPFEMVAALHGEACLRRFLNDIYVGNTMVSVYGKCGRLLEAENVFCKLPSHDLVSWNAMLSTYIEHCQSEKVLQLYRQMLQDHTDGDELTLLSALQACAILAGQEELLVANRLAMTLEVGQSLHMDAWRAGFGADIALGSMLVTMYGKCGSIYEAEKVFDEFSVHEIVLWGALLSAYVEQNQGEKALGLFRQMQEEGVGPNEQTFVIAIQACGMEEGMKSQTQAAALEIGQALHGDAYRKVFTSNPFVVSCLVCMYARCESIIEAEQVLNGLCDPTVVCGNAMLCAYVDSNLGEKALRLYRELERHIAVNDTTFMAALEACALTGNSEMCKHIHFSAIFAGYDFLGSNFVRAYAGCGCLVDATAVFRGLSHRDVMSWTACISAYAQGGHFTASLELFDEMILCDISPNDVTFLVLLSACNQIGFVEKGIELFKCMIKDHDIIPDSTHYTSLIDLLGRSGELNRVEYILSLMPVQGNEGIWMRVLDACRTYGYVELGRKAFDCARTLCPGKASAYILMSSIYTNAGLQECANEIESLRMEMHRSRQLIADTC